MKDATKKRRGKSPAARLRPFWIVFLAIGVAAVAGLSYAATWPGFYPQRVSVSGNRVVPTAQILARAAIRPRTNVWLQNMGAAADRIAAIPYVKQAVIHRSLPAGVRIAITERRPFAVVRNASQRVLVDGDLRVLAQARGSSALPVLFVRGALPADGAFATSADLRRLRDDVESLARAHVAVRSLHYDRFDDLVATTPGGISLLLGDDADLSKKTPLIDPIISQVSASGRKLAAVDLRAPATPVVVYRK
jgi:cell division protein FtsQ